jgi:2-polyprenyl-3-methyl-5-hydroxy-6-metoxy-1,4-benzoquinol methylase
MNQDIIEKFYNEWAYPDLNSYSLSNLVSQGFRDKSDPGVCWNKFFKNKEKFSKIKILIAGCGTHQAGLIAIKNPYADIIGIDVSETSLEIQKTACLNEKLKNIVLIKTSILDFETDDKFDLIICSGVLHHTKDPLKNLQKLSSLLSKNGVISLMLYNESLRNGVYKIQSLIKLLNLETTIVNAKKISYLIHSLDESHSLEKYVKKNSELHKINNFIDTFFNPRDVAFNPLTLKLLIDNTDLSFVGWLTDNYDIDKRLGISHPLYENISKLDVFEQAYCIDLIKEDQGTIDIILEKTNSNV